MSKFLKLIKNEKGATAIEYGLIAALIAVAAIGAMTEHRYEAGHDLQQRFGQALSFVRSLLSSGGGVERRRRFHLCPSAPR